MSPSSSLSSAEVVRADVLLVRDAEGCYRPALAEEVLQVARRVLSRRVRRGATMSSPQAVKDHLRLHLGVLEHEVFCVLFLDAQHRIIELRQMFRGTVAQTSVYPREVVKEGAVAERRGGDPRAQPAVGIGRAEPGRRVPDADAEGALALIDVRVLDHLVVAGAEVRSFAELGLMEFASERRVTLRSSAGQAIPIGRMHTPSRPCGMARSRRQPTEMV